MSEGASVQVVDAESARWDALTRTTLEAKLVHRAYRPLWANGAFADMFLYDDVGDVLRQSSLLALFDADTRAAPDEAWRTLIGADGAVFGRRLFNRRNGALFRVEFLARRIDWDGAPAAALALLDVSEEERAHRSLVAARAEIEASARARRALYASAARSLVEPLRAARARLRTLAAAETDYAEDARDAVSACDAFMARVAHVGELLDAQAPESFRLAPVLDSALRSAREARPAARFEARLFCDAHPFVLGAPARVEQIAFALLETAAQRADDVVFTAAHDSEGLALQVEARGLGAGGRDWTDEPFRLARAMLESEGGVLVARAATRDVWSAHAFAPLPAAQDPLAPQQARDVLVVDDNDSALRVALTLLSALGHRPSAVRSGPEALAALAARRFDLVVMDVHMPGMDGFETARRMRALPRLWAGIPIIAATASAAPELRARASDAGMDAFLLKPIETAKLAEQIALLTAASGSVEPAELHQIEEEDQHDKAKNDVERGHVCPSSAELNPLRARV